MKKKIVLFLILMCAIVFLFSACNIYRNEDWGSGWGSIVFVGVESMPTARGDITGIENVEIIDFYNIDSNWYPFSPVGRSLVRINHHEGLYNFLNRSNEYEWVDGFQDRINEQLKIHNEEFFKNNNLLILSFIAGAVTIGIRLDSIADCGLITITEIHSGRRNAAIPSIGFDIVFAVEIDSNFNPTNFSLYHRAVWTGR